MEENPLKPPAPFTGDRNRIEAFILECNLYMTVRQNIYNDDLTKIAFMLSLMTNKEALQWKQWFIRSITNDQMSLNVPTVQNFVELLLDAFRPTNQIQEAMHQLALLKQGNESVEKLIIKFKLLIGEAELTIETSSDHVHLIRLFRRCLHPQLLNKILFGETIPRTIEGWYEKAIQFDTNYRQAIAYEEM